MIRINQLRLAPKYQGEKLESELRKKAASFLKCDASKIKQIAIVKRSIDARKKPEIFYSYTIDCALSCPEKSILKSLKETSQIQCIENHPYVFPTIGTKPLEERPVIVGTGPCGLFAGYLLADAGFRPILLERGQNVDRRKKDVDLFWQTGALDPDSNVQFGEGGAGTFSDGKLNTLVKDKDGRNRKVLEIFVEAGAPKSILYDAKPHIGTDILIQVVKNMREHIISKGGEFHFQSKVTDLIIENHVIKAVVVNGEKQISTSQCILAIGHSARDTFHMLDDHQIPMEAKSFAVGFRVEHPQELINFYQYGQNDSQSFSPAAYKLTAKTSSGRGVYSFCMCPGGYVVNASSEPESLAVNGMSYSGRNGKNANSAIIISVSPSDYPGTDALSGLAFQQALERKAYTIGKGKIPMETYGDFKFSVTGEEANNQMESYFEYFTPQNKGESTYGEVHKLLSTEMNQAFIEGMEHFSHIIPGFANHQVLLCGIESRTSSPVRIHRDSSLQSEVRGLYPCGEGAGYAGGITSAAMDGIRVAEEIAKQFQAHF